MFVDHELTEPAEPATLNLERLRSFIAAANKKAELEAALKVVKKEMADLEPAILDQFIEAGMQNTKVDGRVVYIQNDIFASPAAGEDDEEGGDTRAKVAEALAQTEYAPLAKLNYNAQSLNAAIREIAREVETACEADGRMFDAQAVEDALPEPLKGVLKVSFVAKLRSRKG